MNNDPDFQLVSYRDIVPGDLVCYLGQTWLVVSMYDVARYDAVQSVIAIAMVTKDQFELYRFAKGHRVWTYRR